MLSILKSLFGLGSKSSSTNTDNDLLSKDVESTDGTLADTLSEEQKSLAHARELSLAFISSLLGVRAVVDDASRQQEDALREALDAEMVGFSEKSIPKLSKNALSLMHDILDPETPQSKIAEAIKEDPALAGKVISIANSPLFVSPGIEVTDLEHALSMLGQLRTKDVVMSALVADKFEVDSYYFETFGKALWQHSSEVAVNARKLAVKVEANPSLAYFIGLIHDVGKLIIFKKLIELHSKEGKEPHPQVFSNLLSDYSDALTRQACEVWGLPEFWFQPILEFQMADTDEMSQSESKVLFLANAFAELHALYKAGEITEFELVWRIQESGSSLEEFQMLYPDAIESN